MELACHISGWNSDLRSAVCGVFGRIPFYPDIPEIVDILSLDILLSMPFVSPGRVDSNAKCEITQSVSS